jgi:hypothetical protein
MRLDDGGRWQPVWLPRLVNGQVFYCHGQAHQPRARQARNREPRADTPAGNLPGSANAHTKITTG